jgi:hypothetical protein
MGLISRRPRLVREIILVLAAKSLALLVIWSVWFTNPQSSRLDVERVRDALYSSQPAIQEGTDRDAQP